ncbi:MAG: HAMP domain-containing sensor histidine kinase [Patescibacteria group bacterium]
MEQISTPSAADTQKGASGRLYIPMLLGIVGASVGAIAFITYRVATGAMAREIGLFILLLLTTEMTIVSYLVARDRERKHAQAILRLKDQFVFVAAHELRAPATAIRWAVDELQKMFQQKSGVTLFNTAQKSSERLLGLVEDLLEVARIEHAAVKYAFVPVALQASANEAVAEVAHLAASEKVEIYNQLTPNLPPVMADPPRLKETLVNLLTNAVKYNRLNGTVTIWADVEPKNVVVHVKDTGIGIKPADQKRVFEKFWRAREKDDIEGTGLGLFIVKCLVENMQGSIWFVSDSGSGSTFSVRLPRSSA